MKLTTISKGGQVSIPAEVRRRWGTTRVLVDDRGDEVAFRPIPIDPIAAARGSLRTARRTALTPAEARRRTREEESDAVRGRGGTH